jgi:cytochrome c-type protein NapB
MKKHILTILTGALVLLASVSAPVVAAEAMESLRGGLSIEEQNQSFELKRQMTAAGGFDRGWTQQPPLVPHKVDNDRISVRENTCLRCHSEKNFEKEKAPRIGDSHYLDRDGNKLDTLSSRRWFCTQCHVPQVDAAPLVENTFGR